ncbi:MAG TPA: GAF domain-containing protein [Solirubrobacteraceae bacterium]|nr:GAF domain-containing protein [Solirubrobacteraceae bacterium]
MTAATDRAIHLPWEPTEALGLFVELLSEGEQATPSSSEFYDHLCEATCRLAHLRRAVIFLWDDARREVRAVGSREVPLEVFSRTRVNTENVPIARMALAEDRVVDVQEDFEKHIPPALVRALRPRNLVCTPMSAGGRWFGVLVAEREHSRPLGQAERQTLWTLGKVAALAASARIATSQQERARRLTERIDLAREIHERVIQRLFAVGMVLGAEGELLESDRRRCLEEVREAVREVRAAVQRPLSPSPPPAGGTLAETLARLTDEHPDLGLRVQWEPGTRVPARFDGLAQTVLAEAVRNARKHASPTGIDVALAQDGAALVLQVVNDGVTPAPPRSGMGLRLAALEALHHGALVDFGPEPSGRWRVRLMMPLEEEA